MYKLSVKLLRENSKAPTRGSKDAVGYDLYASKVEDCGNFIKVYSGIAAQYPVGCHGELVPRSSIYKKGLMLANSIGVCDPDYQGEIIGVFVKTADFKELPAEGERVMQLVIRRSEIREVDIVEDFGYSTKRGSDGFGSSGQF